MGALACSAAAGGRRADKQADWLGGGGALGSPAPRDSGTPGRGLAKRLLGSLPLCLCVCLLGPPCLCISLSFVVHRRPSRLSGPSQPARHIPPVRCRPPSACSARLSPSLPVSGPLLLPIPSSLPYPSTPLLNVCVCLSARGACQATDDEAGIAHPAAGPSRDQLLLQEDEGASLPEVNCCCSLLPLPHMRAWGHSCLIHHPRLRPRLQETAEGRKPGACGVWVFPFLDTSSLPHC